MIFCKRFAKEVDVVPPERIVVRGSGRTDSGVHAVGQVVSFEWPDNVPLDLYRLPVAINGLTARGLSVLKAEAPGDNFDARLSPHIKCYSYRLLTRHAHAGYATQRVWNIGPDVDLPAMIAAAQLFVGQHDFSAFRAADCQALSTQRKIIGSELSRISADELVYQIVGYGFLKHMVRIIVGTLVDVGKGRLSVDTVRELLDSGRRPDSGQTAPPEGLCLEWVRYS